MTTDLVPFPDDEIMDVEVLADADAWEMAVEAWLASKRKAHTRKAYRTDASQWLDWCSRRHVDPFRAEQVTVDTWARHLEDEDRAPKTVARKLSAVASLYTYLVRVGMLAHSPAEHIQRPEVSADHSDTIALDEHQLAAFTAAARADGQRTYVAVLLLGTLGIRSAELLSATVTDYGIDHNQPVVTITRKGGKRVRLPMQRWVAAELEQLLAGRTEGNLIANDVGGPIPYIWLYRRCLRLGVRSLGMAVTPHVLRASFATINFDAGTNPDVTQDFMGHADPRTTRLYDKGRGRIERLTKATATVAKHLRPDADLTTEETA